MHRLINQLQIDGTIRFLENLQIGYVLVDTRDNIVWSNKVFSEMVEYSYGELCKKKPTDILYPEDGNAYLDNIGTHKRFIMHQRFLTKHGNTKWALVVVDEVEDSNKDIIGYSLQVILCDEVKAIISEFNSYDWCKKHFWVIISTGIPILGGIITSAAMVISHFNKIADIEQTVDAQGKLILKMIEKEIDESKSIINNQSSGVK